jgi:threonine synthase
MSDANKRTPYLFNRRVRGLTCLRCATAYDVSDPVVDQGLGCPSCLEQGYPASLRLVYDSGPGWELRQDASGMTRYSGQLPYQCFPSLGEGGTPLVPVPSLAQGLGLARVWLKNEGQNPTGSHKDRMSALAVARAAALGRRTVVAASSGNAGASLAAYAAAAALDCKIISTPKISPSWAQAIEMAGAELLLTDTPEARWPLMRAKVESEGWYPVTNFLDPPVGSNPFGLEGYKTVAFELVEQCARAQPTTILVPTARGDLLWGIWQGLSEACRAGLVADLPRLLAVEPFARLKNVLAGRDYRSRFEGEPHAMTSIGGGTATYQSLLALRASGGSGVEVSTAEAHRAQRELAQLGFYVELSSATALAALHKLGEEGQVGQADRVVLVVTSHGYKELPQTVVT